MISHLDAHMGPTHLVRDGAISDDNQTGGSDPDASVAAQAVAAIQLALEATSSVAMTRSRNRPMVICESRGRR
jgi:hypothetical protein